MINYIITAAMLTLAIPAFGVVMGMLRKIIYNIISLLSPGLAFAVSNYLTFPGVMHHELSHAIFGFLTGAKITKINLFKPQGMSLGSVEMIYRGPWLIRSIQSCLSASAPVFCGIVTCILLYTKVIPSTSGGVKILMCYLLFSILMHMTMSIPDIMCFLKGIVGVYILTLVVCILTRFDLVGVIKNR